MTSLRSTITGTMTALGVALALAPATAQEATPATNQAAPAQQTPTPGTVGNPALENFELNGTVTREASPPPAPTPTPSPAPARSAQPAERSDAAPAAPTPAASARVPEPQAAAPSPSLPEASAGTLPAAPPTAVLPDLMPPPPAAPSEAPRWPWLLAFAAALAAGGWWWMRRRRSAPGEALAYAAPQPLPQPAPQPAPAPRPSLGGIEGGIVSRGLFPKLAFELEPLLFESDEAGSARLTFELTLINIGAAPARDIRVEARMFNAGPQQDHEIAGFFRSPGALPASLPTLAPQGRMPMRSRIGMRSGDYQPLALGGRTLIVPMIAVTAVYRGASGEDQQSASWLVGAGDGEAAKLAPFAIGKPHRVTALAARLHSRGVAAA